MSAENLAQTFLQRLLSGEITPPAFAISLGLEPGEFGVGEASFTMVTEPSRHGNVMGTLHGGALATLADTAMGFAFATTLAGDETFATLEMKVNFVRPVWTSTLTARAHGVHRGKTTGLVECRVTDERERLVGHATSTCLVLSGAQADGRRLGDTQRA